MNLFLANLTLTVHVLFIVFVIFGLLLIVIGAVRQWGWIRNRWFRLSHVLAIGIVVALSWLGRVCPLTYWENHFRAAAGGRKYPDSFIQYWVHRAVFYDLPPWVFTVAYTVFGVLVLLAWRYAPPRSAGPGKKQRSTGPTVR